MVWEPKKVREKTANVEQPEGGAESIREALLIQTRALYAEDCNSQTWLKAKEDEKGWFLLKHVISNQFLTANADESMTIESKY